MAEVLGNPYFWLASSAPTRDTAILPVVAWISMDGGTTWLEKGAAQKVNAWGSLLEDLAAAGNEVDVKLWAGEEPTSRSLKSIATHRLNFIAINGEVMCYENATPLGDDKWTLSGIHRGRRDTTVALQAEGSRWDQLDEDGMLKIELDPADIADPAAGRLVKVKVVPVGLDIDDVIAYDFTVTGKNLVPLRPTSFSAIKVEGSNDVKLRWEYKSRAERVRLFGRLGVPVVDSDDYVIEIYDGAALQRTKNKSGEPYEVTYTAAEQDADFGASSAPLASVKFRVRTSNTFITGPDGEQTVTTLGI